MELRAGVGFSSHPDTRKAAHEAVQLALREAGVAGVPKGWVLCFFSMAHLPRADELREILLAQTGCEALCGCSAHGLVAGAREVENAIGLAVMVCTGGGMDALSTLLPGDGEGLNALALAPGSGGGKELLLALPDAYRADARTVLTRLHERWPELPVYGAGSTDNGTTGTSLQLGMEGVRSSSVAALRLSGPLQVEVGITQSCHPVGDPHFVTAAKDNILLELDGRPALHVLIGQGKALQLESFQQLIEEVMLGFPLDSVQPRFDSESCLVRHVLGFDQATGGIVVPDRLDGQKSMIFMHRNAEQAERDMQRMTGALRARLEGTPDFGIYFDCAARGRNLYGRQGVDTAVIRAQLGAFPLIGMFGGFELATTRGLPMLYTYTGVLILVRRLTA